jgi:DNA-binding protein
MSLENSVNEAVMRALGINVANAVEVQITLKVGKMPEVVVTSMLTNLYSEHVEGTLLFVEHSREVTT